MTTIANLFSVSDDLKKTPSIAIDAMEYTDDKRYPAISSYSLSQGKKFEAYQKKVTFNLDKKAKKLSEGFQGRNSGLTAQSNSLLQETDINSQKQVIENLKVEYESTLKDYKNLIKQINGKVQGYLDRVNPSNPYLNKTVRFTTGHIAYVTNKGVVKYVPNMEIWSSTGIPTAYVDLNIPWDDSYSTPGTIIASTPPLVSGTFLQLNQTIGNEGANVFVDKYVSDSDVPTYKGCYADNTSSPLMTFIGDAPVPPTNLLNGNFENPELTMDSQQYINSVSKVPGWNFSSYFINTSKAWNFPTPYPHGNQAVCFQQQTRISQSIYFQKGVTYTLTFSACNRPEYSGESVYIRLDGVLIFNFTPPDTWTEYSTSFTVTSDKYYTLQFAGSNNKLGYRQQNRWGWWGTPAKYGDSAIALQNIQLGTSGAGSVGSYTYDQCKQSALAQGYQYFALQKVNAATSQGYCAASNSEPTSTSLGESLAVTGSTALWSSNTSGQTGNTCTLTTTGSLSVINSGGQSVFSTDNSTAQPANYIGCYGDSGNRAMPLQKGGSQEYSYSQCEQIAKDQGASYFGLQNSTSGTNAQCGLNNDLAQTREYGKAGNCTKTGDGYSGGGWSNAVYNTKSPDSIYFLSVQGDGNLCVYRGSGPTDNQGEIWCSGTNGKGQSPNPAFVAVNGKYGKDWISSGDTLAAGDFVGSADGTFALVMQSDGNLVLYTYTLGSNCQKMADGNTGAGAGGNAMYGFPKAAVPGNMGKLAYVDEDSQLHDYPSDNVKLVNNYSRFQEIDSGGHDIPGAAYGNATVDQCETTCNGNSSCAGFAFYQNTCFPKDNTMFPVPGTSQPLKGCDVYIKNRQPQTPPIGVPSTTNNTDTVAYQNYLHGGAVGDKYGLSNANTVEKQQLSDLETRLKLITSEINKFTNQFEQGGSKIDNQLISNIPGTDGYLKELNRTNTQIQHSSTSLNRILDDSDIVVLQKNYDYLFWSILAAGAVLVSMNLVKKN
jgi:hypothetical protein